MSPSPTPQSFSDLKRVFSNQMSLTFETDGFSPLVGRIFALLLFAPEPLSLQDMADQLGVTKAAVSVQVRALEKHSMCQKLPTSGRPERLLLHSRRFQHDGYPYDGAEDEFCT
ncbi:hypothetical protein LJK87_17135 [Paenibacillus sp. P25]|nr:hypothetical protein LJK87_17135 [Paenibacillus sp. P25]